MSAACEHVWEYPFPTLDSNPPQEARRCSLCGLVQIRDGWGYAPGNSNPTIPPTEWEAVDA